MKTGLLNLCQENLSVNQARQLQTLHYQREHTNQDLIVLKIKRQDFDKCINQKQFEHIINKNIHRET